MKQAPAQDECIFEIKDGAKKGAFRKVTNGEYAHAKMLHDHRVKLEASIQLAQEELKYMAKNCGHFVCHDIEGHPHNVRVCVSCGHQSLI